jgi:hypothetical protein
MTTVPEHPAGITMKGIAHAPLILICFTAASLFAAENGAPERKPRPVDGIADNSFLVEEAYNQEPGVVQHIFTGFHTVDQLAGPDSRAWVLSYTAEWPVFSQRHQFSYTVPYTFLDNGVTSENGIGDVQLNYRYQAIYDEDTLLAFAPRFSLNLPTGDERRGLSEDAVGYQWNLPLSRAVGDRFYLHANAGLAFVPDAASLGGRDALHYNLGGSVIYAATSDLHFMLELIGLWVEEPAVSGGTEHVFTSLIAPGLRKAFNFRNDSQLVLGVSAPLGLTSESPDYGVFLYVSFEHFFKRPQ